MKITITLFIALLFAKLSFSQRIERQLVATAGNTLTGGGYALSFSIGEVAVVGLPASSFQPKNFSGYLQFASIGFQQPHVALTGNYLQQSWVSAYPNPAVSFVRLDVHGFENQVNRVRIFDMSGRQVLTPTFTFKAGSMEVNISSLPAGYYIITVMEEITHKTASAKILKVN